jgi:hypothetical protein
MAVSLRGPAYAELVGVAVQVHRVPHLGGVDDVEPDPLALLEPLVDNGFHFP